MKIYGIPNCGNVQKAINLVRAVGIEFEFIDFKKQKPTAEDVEKWSVVVTMDKLFNTKGTKYKSSSLDYKTLSPAERTEWLTKKPMMIKRPVIEYKGNIIVGFDEEAYKKFFAS